MHKILCLSLCLFIFFTSSALAEVKIAVFDLQDVADKSDVLKQGKEALRKGFNPRRDQLVQERTSLEKKLEDAVKAGNAQQIREATGQQQAFVKKYETFTAELGKADLRVREDVEQVIKQAAQAFGKKNGYVLVTPINPTSWTDPSQSVTDVTKDMLTETNRIWKSMTR